MAQYGRPISDISTGNWSTTPLWSDLDDNSDADYITSGKNPVADTFENALTSTLSDPLSSSGHIVRARLYCSKASNGTATVYVYRGTTLIATYAIPGNLATAFTTYSYTLTGTETDNITDYTDLRIRVVGNGTANAYVYCAWTELEVPDAVTATEETASLAIFKGVSSPVTYAGAPVSLSLAKFAGTAPTTLVSIQDYFIANRIAYATSVDELSIFEAITLPHVDTLTAEGALPPTEESVTLSHVLYSTISALAQAETVLNLTKSLGKIGTSQAIVNAVTTLNRVNTIPSTSLGTIFDAIGLGYVDTLSVLEETQGQTNENVLLNRVMSILVASQEQSNESINLVRSLGVTPSSQVNVGDAVALNVLRVIAILEETQGSINESVVLNRLLNIVTTSEVVGYETINFNSLYGLSAVSYTHLTLPTTPYV